eukprot:1194633-Prorocentrum_minimum.AAC.22
MVPHIYGSPNHYAVGGPAGATGGVGGGGAADGPVLPASACQRLEPRAAAGAAARPYAQRAARRAGADLWNASIRSEHARDPRAAGAWHASWAPFCARALSAPSRPPPGSLVTPVPLLILP